MKSLKVLQKMVDDWNKEVPVGTVVSYRSLRDGPVTLTAPTAHPATLLGGHTPVVWLDGNDSCIAMTHCFLPDYESGF